ncbi:MAG: DUF3293 domain-containing protein [Xanthomonadales bacterium]|nr:DUF3293 domain-containing protein [Xanthomonadales bacterium]
MARSLLPALLSAAELDALILAYRNTEYWINVGPDRHCIKVDGSPLPDALCELLPWIVLTADNPGSLIWSEDENRQRRRALYQDIQTRALSGFTSRARACSQSPKSSKAPTWPDELGYLVCPLPVTEIATWCARYQQLAVIQGVQSSASCTAVITFWREHPRLSVAAQSLKLPHDCRWVG